MLSPSDWQTRAKHVVCERVRRKLLFAAAALIALGGLWFALHDGEPDKEIKPSAIPHARAQGSSAKIAKTRKHDPTEPTPRLRPAITQEQRAKREAMRRRIIAGLLAQNDATKRDPDDDDERLAKATPRSDNTSDDAPPGNLNDRSGNHSYLLKVMNEDLMPLADECYALALERDPTLAGDLMLNIETIGDEQIGGVVEIVEPSPDNQIVDAQLLECMRESIFATTLPAPDESGRDAFMLSMPLHPE